MTAGLLPPDGRALPVAVVLVHDEVALGEVSVVGHERPRRRQRPVGRARRGQPRRRLARPAAARADEVDVFGRDLLAAPDLVGRGLLGRRPRGVVVGVGQVQLGDLVLLQLLVQPVPHQRLVLRLPLRGLATRDVRDYKKNVKLPYNFNFIPFK